MRKAQHISRDFLDEIRVRWLGGEERDVALEFRPHGFEALEFELEERRALDELQASLEAVTAEIGMMGEVARQSDASEHNKDLPEETRAPESPIMMIGTQHRNAH